MLLQDIIQIAQEYESLGGGAHEQLNNIMAGEAIAKQDRHILEYLVNFLDWATSYDAVDDAAELRDYISDYLDNPESVPPKYVMPTPPRRRHRGQ